MTVKKTVKKTRNAKQFPGTVMSRRLPRLAALAALSVVCLLDSPEARAQETEPDRPAGCPNLGVTTPAITAVSSTSNTFSVTWADPDPLSGPLDLTICAADWDSDAAYDNQETSTNVPSAARAGSTLTFGPNFDSCCSQAKLTLQPDTDYWINFGDYLGQTGWHYVRTTADADNEAPTFSSASVNGDKLTITFNEALGAAANLANSAFAVKKTPSGGMEADVSLHATTGPAISGSTVVLTLATAVAATDGNVTVSYTKPATEDSNRIEDAAGNEADTFGAQSVTNDTDRTITITAGTSPITEGAVASFTVTADVAPNNNLRVSLRVHENSFLETWGSRRVTITAGSTTGTLSLATQNNSNEGDSSDVTVTVLADSGYVVGSPSSASVRVNDDDGDTAPAFSSATVNGDKLTITFNEALAAAANLANSAFGVKKTPSGGSEAGVSLHATTQPAISGSTVVLTLATAVVATDGSIKVSYTKPTTGTDNRIKDSADLETDSFSDQTVTNDTDRTITIEAGTSPITEGTTASYTVTADVAPNNNLTVNLTVADVAGSDFVASGDEGNKTVTIDANSTTATYSVATVADTTDEDSGDVRVTVAAGTGYTVGSPNFANVTVNDDDDPPNSPATGAPTISGFPQGGQTLTAATGGISDSDGLTSVSWSYQWIRVDGANETDISGATSSTYTLATADQGKTIKVKVTFEDDAGNDEELTSTATTAVVAAAPACTTGNVWCATLTVGSQPGITRGPAGYCSSAFSRCSADFGSLSDTSFTLGGTSYTVQSVRWGAGGSGRFHLSLGSTLPDADVDRLTLQVDSHSLALSSATQENDDGPLANNYRWTSTPRAILAFEKGRQVRVELLQTEPTITIAAGTSPVTEGTAAEFTITASPTPAADLTVNLSVADVEDSDFVADTDEGSQTVTISVNTATVTYSVATVADTTDEDSGDVTVTVASGDGYTVGSTDSAVVRVNDDDETDTAPSVSSAAVNGDKLTITFDEALAAAANLSNDAFAVKKTPSGGTEADVDLHATTQPSISGSTVVLTLANAVVASDGSVTVSYTKPTTDNNNRIEDAAGLETDSFSDQAVTNATPIAVSIAAGTSPVTEGTAATFTVTADAAPAANLTVNLTVADVSGSDFVASANEGSKTVTINASSTTATYSVATVGDSTKEDSGDVTVTVAAGAGYTVGAANSASVTVNDDDNAAPTVANEIPNQSATAGTAFSFQFAADTFADTDTGDTLTYTATKGDDSDLPAWLTFAASSRTFSGTPPAADVGTLSVKVTASDGDGGTVSDTFDIVVAAADTAPAFSSAAVNGDKLTITFDEALAAAANLSNDAFAVKKTLLGTETDVDLHATTQPAISGRTVVLTLATAVVPRDSSIKVSYNKPATGTDNRIKDSADLETDSFSDQAVTNNTVPTLTIAAGTSPVTEGTAATFTVNAHAAPAADITVNLTVADVADSDFVASGDEGNKTVTLTADSTSVTYSVATVGDSTKEDSGDVTVTVAAGAGYTVGSPNSAVVTVNDDDNAAPAITTVAIVSNPSIDANDDGTNDTYGAGQAITVGVTWSEAVAWDVSATNAGIRVQLGIGSNNRPAELVTGGATSGTATTLRFAYTVAAGDSDSDGVEVNANDRGNVVRLRSGATLRKADDDTVDAAVTHAGLGAQSGHLVDGAATQPANAAPTVANEIPNQSATAGTAFSFQFAANTFNDTDTGDTLSYTATKGDDNALPGWLTFTASSRTFSGTPEAANIGTLSVKVTASDGTDSVSDTFDIVVAADIAPDFGTETVANQSYTQDTAITDLTLPAATGGNGALSYALTPALPAGLTFTASTRQISGTPTAAQAATTYTYKVTDADANTADGDADTLTFTITVAAADTAPAFSSATVNGDKLTITFDEALAAAANLSNDAFGVKKTPSGGSEAGVSLSSTPPAISGSTVVLTLATAVVPTDGSIKVSYNKPATGTDNRIEDAAGLETDSFSDQAVTNNTLPTVTIAAGTSPVTEGTDAEFTVTANAAAPSAGLTISLSVSESSDGDYVADGDVGNKTVTITSGETTATYSVTTQADSVDETNGSVTVTVTSGTGYTVGSTASATVTVNDDDEAPNNAPVFTGQPATGTVPENSVDGTDVVTGNPAVALTVTATDADAGDTITYSLDTDAAKLFAIDSSGAITVDVADGSALDHEATSSITVTVTASDGTDTADHDVTITIADVQEAPAAPAAPTVTGASRTSVTVNWTAPANTGRPDINDYDVRFKLSTATGWTDHSFTGATTSTTISSLTEGTTYDVQVMAKNAEGSSDWSATGSGDTIANNAPVFTSQPTTATVPENSADDTAVMTTDATPVALAVTATDADAGDTITYSLDADAAKLFAIGSDGAITVDVASGSALDHEGSGGSITVTVTATDDHGGTATHDVTITIADVQEAPAASGAPTVRGASSTSVTVSWTAPANTGPAINDYDVRFKLSTATAWTDHSFTGATTSTTISGLSPSTTYEAQVMAKNAEGDSGWSATGSGDTNANAAPVFTSQPTTATVPENSADATAVMTGNPAVALAVTATDADAGDTITYSLDTDAAKLFAIDSSGAITVDVASGSALDHEATSSITVTVTATDDHGGTATHDVTITIADVQEAPAAPGAPTVRGASSTSVTVSWTAPANTGRPAINDYEVRYQASGATGWTDHSFSGTGISTTISGLSPSTTYNVQVQAENNEGHGNWSASGSGDTNANIAPVFTSQPTTATVAENSADETAVQTGTPAADLAITATDANAADTITYSLDTDAAKVFAIDSDGKITVDVEEGSALDHEGSGGSITVTVTATDDHGGTATHDVTITVTDVNEPPAAPDAPTVTGASTSSLSVSWTAPANTGPAINDYDVEYKSVANTLDPWTAHDFTGAGTRTTINVEDASSRYDVRVKAKNAEGDSGWSATGSGSTHDLTITIAPGTTPVTEGTAATFTLTASPAVHRDLVVPVRVSEKAGSDFVAAADEGTQPVTIASGDTSATYSVTTQDDSANEPDGSVTVLLVGSNDYTLGATTSATVTVNDNDDPPTNPPVFTNQPTTASVPENSADGTDVLTGDPPVALTITATDVDSDTLSYSLDSDSAALFSIDSHGAITVQVQGDSALDHEALETITVTVAASDGTGTASHEVTVSVTDEDEPPDAPEAPTVTAASSTSVTVTWTAPENDGKPDISGYNVRYRVSGATAWTDHSFTGTGVTTTIPGLSPSTTYEVQVQAANHEGTSDYSATGSGATTAPANRAPVFTSVPSSLDTAENSAGGTVVGTVAATDADGDTLTYSLDATSGAVFDIDSSGVITVASDATLDYEDTPSYAATVTVTDGAATVSQAVTIDVTDEFEPPDAPEAPTVTAASSTSVTVAWTAPDNDGRPDITGYGVRYRVSGATAWTDDSFTGAGIATTIAGLSPSTTYEVQVQASNNEGTSGWSEAGSGTTSENSAPVFTDQPTTVEVAENALGGTALVAITATDADGDTLSYSLDSASDEVFDIDSNGLITVQAGATPDHEATPSFAAVVTASDGAADVTHSLTITVTDILEPPDAPAAPAVTGASHTSVTVSWTAPDTAGRPDITGYDVRYRASGADDWTGHDVIGTSTSTTISDLAQGTTYEAQVMASNDEGSSDWSVAGSGSTTAPANSPPVFTSPPSSLDIAENSIGDTEVGTVAATDADGDTLTYSLDATSAAVFDIDSSGDITVASGAELDHEATPRYAAIVTVTDGAADVTHSLTITVTDILEPPDAPAAPAVTGASHTSVTVSWTAPDTAGRPDITGYDVRYRASGADDWTGHDVIGTSTSTTISGLAQGTTYEAQVMASNDEGSSDWSATGSGATTAPANSPPVFTSPPSSLDIAENSIGDTEVGTVAATDADGDTLTYSLDATSAAVFDIDSSGDITVASGAELDHEATPRYAAIVTVTDGAATVTHAVTINVTDEPEPPDAPDTPTVTAASSTSVTVAWTAPDNDGRPDITGYDVRYRASGADDWTGHDVIGTSTSTTISGLVQGTTYEAQVMASNDEGSSDWSATGSGATGTPTPATTITIAAGTSPVTEGTAASFTLTASPAPTVDLTVNLSVADASGSDFVAPGDEGAKTVAIGSGASTATYSVATQGDTTDEPNGPVTVTVSAGDGYTVGAMSSASVTVNDDDDPPNNPPVFTNQPTTATVAENSADGMAVLTGDPQLALTVTATDADGDTIAYSLDSTSDAVFDIDSNGAVTVALESGSALDHEATPSITATVTATDSNNATATHEVTISVTDLLEPPDAPAAPRVTGVSATSVTVNWTAPINTGRPDISDYDLRYRASGATEWTDHGFAGSGTSTTISDLSPSTTYEAQVMAANDEGTSGWSATGSGQTGVAPPPASGRVSGSTVTLEFEDELDTQSVPDPEDFTVALAGEHRVTAVSVEGSTLVLTIDPPVPAGQEVAVSYKRGTTPLRTAAGQQVEEFTQTVSDEPPPPEATAPVFDDGTPRSFAIAENIAGGTLVGSVSATDEDGDTPVYSLASANGDHEAFAIDSDGRISVADGAVLDFEAQSQYLFRAEVTDGEDADGNIEDTPTPDDMVEVAVEVTNVPEPPGEPRGVTVTATSSTSLEVTWTAPEDPGAGLDGYGVQYRASGETQWTDHPHSGTATRSLIEGLLAGTAYEVRVQSQGDGNSAWTGAEGRTAVAPPAVSGMLPDLTLVAGAAAVEVNAAVAFTGQELVYMYTSSNAAVASFDGSGSATVNAGASARLRGESAGEAQVTVTASNAGGSASVSFAVTVKAVSDQEAEVLGLSMDGLTRTLLSGATGVIGARMAASETLAPPLQGFDEGDARSALAGLFGLPAPAFGDGLAADGSASAGPWTGPARGFAPAHADAQGAGRSFGAGAPPGGISGPHSHGQSPIVPFGFARSGLWNRSFAFSIAADADRSSDNEPSTCGAVTPPPCWTIWGAGDIQRFNGGEGSQVYDGGWRTAYLGADRRLGQRWVAGVAVSRGHGEADYGFGGADAGEGELRTDLTALYPYVKGVLRSGAELWATLGVGEGEARNTRGLQKQITNEGDLRMTLAAAGLRHALTERGALRLSVVADAGTASLDIDGEQSLQDLESTAHRARAGLELSGTGAWSPYVQVSGRYDGGGGMSEAGYEAEAGLRRSSPRWDFELRGRWMRLSGDTEYEESGGTATLRIKSTADGTGLAASLTPTWGKPGGTDFVWSQSPMPTMSPWAATESGTTVNAELGYGIKSQRLRGLLTPQIGYGRGAFGSDLLRFGADYAANPIWLPLELSIGVGLHRRWTVEGPDWGWLFHTQVWF